MKNSIRYYPKLILLIILLIVHYSLFTIHCQAQQGQWTWMNGSNVGNQTGSFGAQGTFAAGNTPPGLFEACEWTDLNGNFWLFGGMDFTNGLFQTLWEFKPSTNQWAWISGTDVINQAGVYGVQGIPSVNNIPGGRTFGMTTWVDSAGDLWLFGGNGLGNNTTNYGNLNDLWRYHIATSEWTWMNGPDTVNNAGSYGAIQITAPANLPPSRCGTNASWADTSGNLWFFGGYILQMATYSDLWKYNLATNEWTWMKGPNLTNQPASYGTKGVPDPLNNPSCRAVYAKWKDHAGNFYLYAGNKSNFNNLSDLWRFNIASNSWTWMDGANTPNDSTLDNGQCITNATNHPGSRYENRACWTMPCDNFVFFGGANNAGGFNDLWYYSVATNQWTLMSGSTASGAVGSYGTITISSPTNVPPCRYGSNGWRDTSGNLWMFGGQSNPFFNDIWRFVPDTACPYIPNTHVVSSFTHSPLNGCGSLADTFHNTSTNGSYFIWNFGDSTSSSVVNPTHIYSVPGTYYVSLIAIPSCGGLPDTARDTIHVHNFPIPTINSTGTDTFCQGNTVNLTVNNTYASYLWNTNAITQTITADSTATYMVTVTDTNGCSATASYSIYVIPLPVPNPGFFSDTTTGCTPLTIHFINTSNINSTFLWNFGDGTTDTARNPFHTYTNADSSRYTIYLVVKDSNLCVVIIDTVFEPNYIWVNIDNPVAAFISNYTIPIYVGDSIHFQDESFDAFAAITLWQWSFGDGEGSNFINPIHNWNLPGTYKVELTVTDRNGCHDSTYFRYIDVIEGLLNIPNTFTPNNDGYNDYFEITTSGLEVYNLEIFNRWGMLLFQTTGNHLLWDGYDQVGLQCPEGTYYYSLKAAGYSGTNFSKAGFILLMR
jgi:gliding motility-associated-like protein